MSFFSLLVCAVFEDIVCHRWDPVTHQTVWICTVSMMIFIDIHTSMCNVYGARHWHPGSQWGCTIWPDIFAYKYIYCMHCYYSWSYTHIAHFYDIFAVARTRILMIGCEQTQSEPEEHAEAEYFIVYHVCIYRVDYSDRWTPVILS